MRALAPDGVDVIADYAGGSSLDSVPTLLAADGNLKVEIAATYPLDEAPAAYAALEEGHTRGKVVVTV